MNPETIRPLTFGLLLVHPPVQHSDKTLRELFNVLGTAHEFTQYEQSSGGSFRFQRVWSGTGKRLVCDIRNDRIEVLHDLPEGDLHGFWRTAEDILSQSVRMLNIPMFLIQQCLIRKLASPLTEPDARLFLLRHVCSIDDQKLQAFGRPVHGTGLRFFFSPSQDMPVEFDVKVESLLRDPNQLFLENTAKFYAAIQPTDLAKVWKNLTETDSFLSDTAVRFLCQFNPSGKG